MEGLAAEWPVKSRANESGLLMGITQRRELVRVDARSQGSVLLLGFLQRKSILKQALLQKQDLIILLPQLLFDQVPFGILAKEAAPTSHESNRQSQQDFQRDCQRGFQGSASGGSSVAAHRLAH